jgi:hypothetical protein
MKTPSFPLRFLASLLVAGGLPLICPAALIHHWTFDGTLSDSGSAANPLVLQTNASLDSTCAPLGSGALFLTSAAAPLEGGAQTAAPTTWSSFASGDIRTVAFWMKATPNQEANATMFGGGTNLNGTRFDIKVLNNLLRVEVQGAGQTTSVRVDTGRWHHIAIVLPNTASTIQNIQFFVDGASVPNGSTSTAAINTANGITRIGDSSNAAFDRDFNGHLDDIRVYDNALTPTEIQNIFNAGRLARCFSTDDQEIIIGSSANLSWEAAHQRTSVSTGTADNFTLGSNQLGASAFNFALLTSGPTYYLRANSGTYLGRLFKITAYDDLAKTFTLENGDLLAANGTAALWNGAFDLYSYTLNYETLTLTNNQNATVIDAAALSTAGLGTLLVTPSVTTTYTLTATAAGGTIVDTRQVTINVKTAPDINTFIATPTFVYGVGSPALNWTSSAAKRIEISNGAATLATYTLSGNGQPFLDAGTFAAPAINATTTYTLSAWLEEAGTGTPATLQSTVTVQPAPDFTLHASPAFTTAGTPVTLNWNATVVKTNAATGTFELFAALPSDPLTDSDVDFNSILQSGTTYYLEITNGNIAGSTTTITSWLNNDLFVSNNFAEDSSWTTYRIFTQSGTNLIVIHDGTSTIATITDPLQIASGTLVLDPGPSATTTYTATASITGATSNAVDTATVTVGGPTTTYPATVLAANPVAYYRFEENTGTPTFYDSSGNGNHSVSILGSITRAVPGPLGTCADFNNNATLTTPVTLNPQDPDGDDTVGDVDPDATEGWTLEALMRPEVAARAAGNQIIFANQDAGGIGRSMFFLDVNGRLTSFVGNTTSPNALATSNTNQKAGNLDWCHAALTCTYNADPSSYTFRFYLDGSLVSEQIIQTPGGILTPPESSTGRWVIGSQKIRQVGSFFDGQLDEAAIYNRALSPTEIAAHNAAFLASSSGALALDGPIRIARGQGGELRYKTGGTSSSASIDQGIGSIPLGTSGTIPINPSSNTTYTLNVDGQTLTFSVEVIEAASITAIGTDNGTGFPFITAGGLTQGISYRLRASDDLLTWTNIGTPIIGGPSGTATFTDSSTFDPILRPKRFYQIIYIEP